MKEADFGKQYKAQMETLYAPKDLIARTQKKVAAEAVLEKARQKRRRYFYSVAMTAAAVMVVFVGVLTYTYIEKGSALKLKGMQFVTNDKNPPESEVNGQPTAVQTETILYLGQNEVVHPKEFMETARMAILPMDFLKSTAWEEKMGSRTVKFTVSETGYYMAAYEEAEAYVVIYSQITDAEEMKDCVQLMLFQRKGAYYEN